jgi:hypothetical protein
MMIILFANIVSFAILAGLKLLDPSTLPVQVGRGKQERVSEV